MQIDLTELYGVLGDNTGVSFTCEDLPGVVVSVGFILKEKHDEVIERSELLAQRELLQSYGSPHGAESGESGGDAAPAVGYRKDLH